MKVNTNRDKISLEETLAYIKYINREQPFNKDEILIPTKDLEEQPNSRQPLQTPHDKQKKLRKQEVSEDLTKKINKNRAIKRIIESAFQILQNFSNYEEDHGDDHNDKSSEIQFNIYLKQFNRVLEMINTLEKEKVSRQTARAENREEVLQNIYEYTVVQDFREILPVAVLKDKISKTNIEIMIDSLSKSLVVLKPNELRIYDSIEATGTFRSIKLHEIENVDYHTQPHIFMVLSIQKDKERFNIYLQFQSEKNQEKWDRALYCCYIGRKMKTKEKFFLIEYPEEDVKKKQKEQTKKQAAFNYDIQHKQTPIHKILSEKYPPLSDLSRDDLHDREETFSRSNTKGPRQQFSNISKEDASEMLLREEKSASQIAFGSKSNKMTNNDSETNRLLQAQKKEKEKKDEMIGRVKTDYIEVSKPPAPEPVHTPHAAQTKDRSNIRANIFGNFDTQKQENRDYLQRQNQLKFSKEENALPEDIVMIHNLERKNVKGLVLEKEKFFFNKAKILFLKEGLTQEQQQQKQNITANAQQEYEAMKMRELEYWDFDNKSGEKSERKVIKLISIKGFILKEEKTLTILHDKQIVFTGDPAKLKQVHQWIELIHNTYKPSQPPVNPSFS